MFATFCLLWSLAQKIFTASELTIKLVIQIISVCDDYDSRTF